MHRLLLPLILLLAAPAFAQADPSAGSGHALAGDWAGDLDVSAMAPGLSTLTVVFHLVPEGDGYTATFDSPDQGAFGLPVDSVGYDAATRTLTLVGQQIVYTGVVDAEAGRIEGTWRQGGGELPLVLTPYEAPAEEAAAAPKADPKRADGDLTGDWSGAIALPTGGEIRMTFRLMHQDDGTHTAVLDAPGQAENLELGPIAVEGREVTIDVMGQAAFTGTLSADETAMEGTFAQGGQKLPMTLTRQ